MKQAKIISLIASIFSVAEMIFGCMVVTYYVNNLLIRMASVFVLIITAILVTHTTKMVFTAAK